MLPPILPDTSESIKETVEVIEATMKESAEHTFAAIKSSLWILGGVFAVIFGGLGVLLLVVFSMTGSESSHIHAQPNHSGDVQGIWTDYYYSEARGGGKAAFDSDGLKSRLAGYLATHNSQKISIVVAPVGPGEAVRLNEGQVFTAASTTKLLTAAAILSKVDDQKLAMDSIAYQLQPVQPDAEKQATPSASPTTTPTPSPTPTPKLVTVEKALELMVNQSDNTAWEKLIGMVGSRELQSYANELGMADYNVRSNQASPHDLMVLLQKLYRGELLTSSSTKHLLSLMQNTNDERMIPAAMDRVGQVYHKYGWLGSNLHDVAIVDNHGLPVVVIIMTEGMQSHDSGQMVVREIAEIVEEALVDAKK